MNEKTLKALEKLLPLVEGENYYLQTTEFVKAFQALAKVIKDLRMENKETSANVVAQVEEMVQEMVDEHKKISESTKEVAESKKTAMEQISKDNQAEFKKTLASIQKDFASLREDMSKVENGKDADEEAIKERVLAEIKLPEYKEVILDTPEQVRDKLETLKEDERLDVSAIKGLGERELKLTSNILDRAVSILDNRTSFLINKVSALEARPSGGGGSGTVGPGTTTELAFFDSANTVASTPSATWDGANLKLTAPWVTQLKDNAGQAWLQILSAASAVNNIVFSNSATGGDLKMIASGTDTDIGFSFEAKGAGMYKFKGTSAQAATIQLYEDTDVGTNFTAFKVGTQAGDITYTLPTSGGSAGEVLTDVAGNGVLSWEAPAGGGITIDTTTISGGTDLRLLYDNAGTVGETPLFSITGSTQANMASGYSNAAGFYHYLFGSRNGGSALSLDGGGWYAIDSYGQISFGIIEIASTDKSFATRYGRKLAVANLNAATLTLTQSHHVITVEYTATGAVTITLPAASSSWNTTYNVGTEYWIFDTGPQAAANNITVNRAGTDTIITTVAAATAATIVANGGGLHLQCINATTWKASRINY